MHAEWRYKWWRMLKDWGNVSSNRAKLKHNEIERWFPMLLNIEYASDPCQGAWCYQPGSWVDSPQKKKKKKKEYVSHIHHCRSRFLQPSGLASWNFLLQPLLWKVIFSFDACVLKSSFTTSVRVLDFANIGATLVLSLVYICQLF